MEEMMILRNMIKIKSLSRIGMQRELRISEIMRGVKELRVAQPHNQLMVFIQ
jgi:hypothetical protein